MIKNPKLTILSSNAKDVLLDPDGRVMDTKIRGPAYFLKQAFIEEDVDFELVTGPTLEVHMTRQPDGTEKGMVPEQSLSTPKPIPVDDAPNILISTILDEYDLSTLKNTDARLFLDVQGYVRDRNNLGKKRQWNLDAEIASKIFCLKGTQEEMEHLPSDILEAQKEKLLIVTDGPRGCAVFDHGEEVQIQPKDQIKTINTIGAGDTFFAHFIAQLFRTDNAKQSAEYATEKTEAFLRQLHPLI